MKIKFYFVISLIVFSTSYKGFCQSSQWELMNSGTGILLEKIHFADDKNGYISGDSGVVLKTTDGGLTWKDVRPVLGSTYYLTHVYCYNKDTAFTEFYRTNNGGTTWDSIGTPFGSIYFINKTTGFIFGSGVYKTTDRGTTWNLLYPLSYATDFFILNDSSFFVGGLQGKIYKTTDQGTTWTTINTGMGAGGHINTMFFWNNLHGIAYNSTGKFAVTYNGGEQWDTFTVSNHIMSGIQGTIDMRRVYFLNDSSGFAMSTNICLGLFKTNDKGMNWSFVDYPAIACVLSEMYFVSPTTGFVIGGEGSIFKFSAIPVGTSEYVKASNDIKILIYPNPAMAKEGITIQCPEIPQLNKENLIITDISGRRINTDMNVESNKIHFANLVPGLYFLNISYEGKIQNMKIVLE